MPLLAMLVLAFTALLFGSAAPASAEDRGFLALFEGQPETTAVAPDTAVASDQERLAREYPDTTRELMPDPTNARPGTITIDTEARLLYLSLPNGMAWRYGVGVGREGFEWRGRTRIGRKETWPAWTPPAAMLKRRPDLPRYMAGGEDNPLGARAMYLYSGDRDTGFRIHGSNEPWTIGHAVSSGCIRMLNEDVTDLFNRVKVGAPVVVL
jgi:lipoprotein-anchoring transpeptidase ErfK/SrfK